LGYTILKLYEDNQIINDGFHTLPISKGDPAADIGYITTAKWSKQNALIVKTKLR
jgi:hypothetical protein